jgi:hypothetical protein
MHIHVQVAPEGDFRRKTGEFTNYIRHAITKHIDLKNTGHA